MIKQDRLHYSANEHILVESIGEAFKRNSKSNKLFLLSSKDEMLIKLSRLNMRKPV